MAQKKLFRFEAIKSFPNVLQYPGGIAGKWNQFFGNSNPLVLELACGKGEYTVGLARMFPKENFIGVDLKGNRLFVGAKTCLEEHLTNAAFLRTEIDKLNHYFRAGEIREIWLPFPDPQLRKSRDKKRLTHPRFLRVYQQVLVPGGFIHLKTDSPVLFNFTLRVIDMYGLFLHEADDNILAGPNARPELQIKTHYEQLDISGSQRIHYLRFSLPRHPLPPLDKMLHQKVMEHENVV